MLDSVVAYFIPEDSADAPLIGEMYVAMLAAEFCSGSLTPEQLRLLMPDSDAHWDFLNQKIGLLKVDKR